MAYLQKRKRLRHAYTHARSRNMSAKPKNAFLVRTKNVCCMLADLGKLRTPWKIKIQLLRSVLYNKDTHIANSFSKHGFKILLDFILCAKKEIKLKEIGYSMRARYSGDGKMDHVVVLEYLQLLIEHSIGKVLPVRFIFFVLVGTSGLLLHLLNLRDINQYSINPDLAKQHSC